MLPKLERTPAGGHRDPMQFYQGGRGDAMSGQMMPMSGARPGFSPGVSEFDELNEPPLLEELGIDFGQIFAKTSFVLFPMRINSKSMEHGDLAGPLVFCIILGAFLLLDGKLYFGYIYGLGIIGCLVMYTVLNLMSETDLDMHRIVSVLGYCLLPVVLLAAASILLDLSSPPGLPVALVAVCWCTLAAVLFIERVFHMTEQRYLIAYPIFLFYSFLRDDSRTTSKPQRE